MRPQSLVTAATALIVACLVSPAPVRAESNLLFILDSSGSMRGKLEGKTKMETAKAALSKLVGDLPQDTKVGLMAYGHRYDRNDPNSCTDIELLTPVGASGRDEVVSWIERVNPKGKTPISGSLGQSPAAFAGLEESNNNIVLISDGIETCGGDPCAAADELAKSNINVRVHVVGFDISEQDRAQLECIATLGKGKYFSANSTEGFTEAVAEAIEVAQIETAPEPVIYFEDNFDGEDLAEHWEVQKPNPDNFIVENGALLVLSGAAAAGSTLTNETVENVFKLSKPLPAGDWTITAKFSVDIQTGLERAFIGIIDDGNNYLEIAAQAFVANFNDSYSSSFNFVGMKRSKGTDATVSKNLWNGEKFGDWYNIGNFADGVKNFPQPILLRLQKRGRNYIGSAMLAGAEEPQWITLDRFTLLRLRGKVSFGFHQQGSTARGRSGKIEGESTAEIDWIKIETTE